MNSPERVGRPLKDAVADLAFQGHFDAPAEALRRLCLGEWRAHGDWIWQAWMGEPYSIRRNGEIPVEKWEVLRQAQATGLTDLKEGECLPRFSDESNFPDHRHITREFAAWFWSESMFETALLIGPDREERFAAINIEICEPQQTTPPVETSGSEPPNKGGRPPIWDWEAAALAMAGLYFVDVWKPANVADVVRALQDWASEGGQDLPDATARPHAKQIFEAIQRWENAP